MINNDSKGDKRARERESKRNSDQDGGRGSGSIICGELAACAAVIRACCNSEVAKRRNNQWEELATDPSCVWAESWAGRAKAPWCFRVERDTVLYLVIDLLII